MLLEFAQLWAMQTILRLMGDLGFFLAKSGTCWDSPEVQGCLAMSANVKYVCLR